LRKPFLDGGSLKTRDKGAETSPFGRLSLCQMRRLRDRPNCHGQLPAFNTAADEKINAASVHQAPPFRFA